jgi:hypothetical protein
MTAMPQLFIATFWHRAARSGQLWPGRIRQSEADRPRRATPPADLFTLSAASGEAGPSLISQKATIPANLYPI